jgi:N-acetylmuramoyl-L-alanine amidase
MVRVLGLKVGRIVLDAGHGGHDTGTLGPGGLTEKDLVLDVTKRLGALIDERLGAEVIYTRSDDTFIPLERRTEIANDAKADLFLSIHANSSPLRTAAGVETYYLSFTTSKTALDVAARENASAEKSIYELQDLLQKIALKDKVDESRDFATRVQDALYSASVKTNPRARDRGVRKAPFVVLIGASMPSILAEIGFLSNSREEALLKKPEHRQKLAEALYQGVSQYARTLSHFQVAQRTGASE